MKKCLLILFVLVTVTLQAQKVPLNNNVYDGWKSVNQTVISDNGKWVAYTINPQLGDGWLYIYDSESGKKDSVSRGLSPVFSPDCSYIAWQVTPAYSETRQAKKKKLKEDQMPKSSMSIRLLPGNEVVKIDRVKSFSLPDSGSNWMAYLLEKAPEAKKEVAADTIEAAKASKKSKTKIPESKGTEFVIYNPGSKKEYRYSDVIEYTVAKGGNSISFLQQIPDTTKTPVTRVSVFDTNKETLKTIFESKGTAKKIATDKPGNFTAFIFSSDTSKTKIFSLWLSASYYPASRVVDTLTKAMPEGCNVSENGNLAFSENGARLYFGTAKKPVKEPADTLLDEEKYKLDIWSWDDDQLQPMQKKQLDQDLKRTWQALYNTVKKTMIQLADTSIQSVRVNLKTNNEFLLGISDLKYQKLSSWESRNYSDYYLINAATGSRSIIFENYPAQVLLSATGKYLISWDPDKLQYNITTSDKHITRPLLIPVNLPLYDELNDTPSDPSPYGIAGWSEQDNEVLIYDKFDIWSFRTDGKEAPFNLTNGFGRKNNIRFRYIKSDPDEEFINMKGSLLLSAFNTESKESGFYSIKPSKRSDPVKLIFGKAAFSNYVTKAKEGNKIIWQKESFDCSPELYISNLDFSNASRLSVSNPQQANYNWLTAELVEWTSFDRQKLQGVLYKPENFDPSLKYPMIVYFYERSSDGLYRYFAPAPSASIINRSFAVSNGYLLFVPDIPYSIGYPGESCYNAVMSGTYSLLSKYSFIDKDRLGLDGQSWGGYQIAWLVTRTDLFKCAYAGAAVSDMISAYGGIRWESGMSRMFQYEHTQSRIGGSLWEKPIQFIENSPIFYVPKINTPLLLMNNDADGAVPWYQGIEFITALRRLGKPAWMLSYNDEAHNLLKRPNKKDLSIRKMQFFDHYLKGTGMPSWMKNGIPQTEKGKKDGYNLIIEN